MPGSVELSAHHDHCRRRPDVEESRHRQLHHHGSADDRCAAKHVNDDHDEHDNHGPVHDDHDDHHHGGTAAHHHVRPQETGDLASGSDGSRTQALQRALADQKYDPGPVDGQFGLKTVQSVWAWQALHGLPRTGVVTPDQER